MRLIRKGKKGFTLVELVVVIAVIAILSAVSVGAYFGITDSANNSRLDQEARMVRSNIQLVASGTDTNVSLRKDGLYIKNVGDFEGKLNEYSGLDYFVTNDENDLDSISRPTIFLKEAGYTLAIINGAKTYKTFDYYNPDVSGKKAYVDLVNDNLKIINDNFTIVEPCEHNRVEGEVLSQPTCINNGSKQYTCSKCEETKTEDIPLDPNAHAWDAGTVSTPATCNTPGEMSYVCTHNPAHKKTETIAIDGEAHEWDAGVVTTDPTCVAEGVRTFTCIHNSEHKKTESVAIDENAHEWDEGQVTTSPTCSADGIKTFTCKHNNLHTKTVALDPDNTAHEWDDGVITTQPTCSTEGVRTFTCKHDNLHTKTEPVAINEDAHEWDAGVITTPSTCSSAGERTFTCIHNSEHKKTESVAIDPNAHKWNNGEITQHPTCTEIGKQTLICEYNPEHTSTGDVAMNPEAHKWNDNRVIKDPTCTEVGKMEQVCEYDPNHTREVDIPIDEDAHEWDEGTVTTQPTCSTEGEKTFTCKHNNAHTTTESVAINGEAHEWDEGKITTDPTCTEKGIKTYTCKHNNSHTTEEEIPATGHLYENGSCKNPNCDQSQILYLIPNMTWISDNARFAAYFYGNGNTWVSMTDTDNDGIYEVTVPQGGYTNVIFCRMNPDTIDNNWNDGVKWNQTINLNIPSNDENNCYTIKGNSNNEGKYSGEWSTYATIDKPTSVNGYVLLKVNSNWKQSYAWFAINLCNGSKGTIWIKMEAVEGKSDYYKAKLPDDFSVANYKNIIFCRMNSASNDLDWGNRWNQSGDLDCNKIINGNNCCAINSGQRDCGSNVTWYKTEFNFFYKS